MNGFTHMFIYNNVENMTNTTIVFNFFNFLNFFNFPKNFCYLIFR